MTLLESVVAFVVLALVGIACLDLSRGAVELQRSSEAWTQAVSVGESALAAAAVDAPVDASGGWGQRQAGDRASARAVTVERRIWRDGVDVIEVTVPLASGGVYRVSRLVARASTKARVATAVAR